MKTAESKTTSSALTTAAKTQNTPFFSKEAQGGSSFFGGETAEAEPFFSPRTLQPKLTIGAPNDKYEQQADAVADQVVAKLNSPTPSPPTPKGSTIAPPTLKGNTIASSTSNGSISVQAKCDHCEQEEKVQKKDEEIGQVGEQLQMKPIFDSAAEPPPDDNVQRKCADCEKEEAVQKKSDNTEGEASSDFSSQLNASKGGGTALSSETQQQMGKAMGADFAGVRIHTGSEAAKLSDNIGAQAFTHGNDVYFNEGKYNPSSTEGSHLLAHELTHTVQQGAAVKRKPVNINPAVHAMHITDIQREKAENDILQRSWLGDAWDSVTSAVGSLNPRNAFNRVAMNIPGFRLVTVIIGHNPILDEAVPRTAENFIGGFLGLIPGGNLLFEKLQETHAIPQAMQWLEEEVSALNITLAYVGSLISRVIDSISVTDISGSIERAVAIVREPAMRVMRFLGRVGTKIKEFIFRGALQLVGAPVEMVMGILTRAGNVLESIFNDPIGFGRNLMQSIVGGIRLFAANAGQHLMNGLIGWLTGALTGAGLQLPQQWNLAGIFSLVAQLLNMTYQAIRVKAVRVLGEPTVARLEQVFDFVRDLITRGPIVLWERVSEFLGNLQEMVMGGIREFVMTRMIQQGVARLVSMFNPAGALIQAVMAIWNTIQFFMERASQLATFAGAVFESIAHIASGNIGSAMTWIENALARSIPVILGFLGRLLGLGNISEHIRGIIERIRRPIDTAIDKVIDWLVSQARRLINGVRGGGAAAEQQQSPERAQALQVGLATLEQKETTYSTGNKITHENAEKTAQETQAAHPSVFSSITVIDAGRNWGFNYVQRVGETVGLEEKAEGNNADYKSKAGYLWLKTKGLDIDLETKITAFPNDFPLPRINKILDQIDKFKSFPSFFEKVKKAISSNGARSPNHGFFYEIEDLANINDIKLFDVAIQNKVIDVLNGEGMLIDQKYEIKLEGAIDSRKLSDRTMSQYNAMKNAIGTTIEGIKIKGFEFHISQPMDAEILSFLRNENKLEHFKNM